MAKRSKKWKTNRGEVSAALARMPVANGADWLWGLILLLAVVLTYTPVFWAGYIWDDDLVLTSNPCIIGPLGLKEIWTTNAADICPLTLTTFWIEHALWGLAPLPYHVVNVLLHAAGAIVLWRVLQSLRVPGAWFGAALWALHPVMVESVAWISEMKNTESGLFYLLSILFFVKGLSTTSRYNRSGFDWNYALTLLFAALAMASKSSTVILPVVLCLCAWWLEGRWQWRNVIKITPIFLLSVVAGLISVWTQGFQLATEANPQSAQSWPERLVTAGDAVWFYLGKLIWPHPLITIYPGWGSDASHLSSYLPLATLLAALAVLWLKRETWARPWFFAFAYFLVALLPALGLADNYILQFSPVFDHLQYLASMGPLALAGAGIARLMSLVIPEMPRLQIAIRTLLLTTAGILSWQRAWAYESQETLWTDTLKHNPNAWPAHGNLGQALFQKGEVEEAIGHYRRALELNPNSAETHCLLGAALFQKGELDEAIGDYQKALQLYPNFPEAECDLGIALLQKGSVDEAIGHFQKALEIRPNFTQAHFNLGNALARKGQMDEAIAQYQMALALDPNNSETHNNFGAALYQEGRWDEALVEFQEALRLNPSNNAAQTNLAKAQAKLQRTPSSH